MNALRITHVAIRDLAGKIWSMPMPARHHNIFPLMADTWPERPIRGEEGFLDSDGRFVDRVEAGKIAIAAGQVGPETKRRLMHRFSELFSEDLW